MKRFVFDFMLSSCDLRAFSCGQHVSTPCPQRGAKKEQKKVVKKTIMGWGGTVLVFGVGWGGAGGVGGGVGGGGVQEREKKGLDVPRGFRAWRCCTSFFSFSIVGG